MRWLITLVLFTLNGHAVADRYLVDTTADTSQSGDGCSLREALESVNAGGAVSDCIAMPASGIDRVEFLIPGPGPHIVVLTSPLPPLVEPVLIDGLSQPGSQCQRDLRIQITDDRAAPDYIEHVFSLAPGSDGSVIRGLSIAGVLGHNVPGGQPTVIRYFGDAVRVGGAENVQLYCLNLGISSDGKFADPVGHGISVDGPVSGLVLGTDGDGIGDSLEKNLILAMGVGITLKENSLGQVRTSGNWIGIDHLGQAPVCGPACNSDYVRNIGGEGFIFFGAVDGLVGYDGEGARIDEGNVIRVFGFAMSGIGNSQSLQITGNMFGVSPDGSSLFPPFFGALSFVGGVDSAIQFGIAQPTDDSEFTGNVVVSRRHFSSLEIFPVGMQTGSVLVENNLFVGFPTAFVSSPTYAIRSFGTDTDNPTTIHANYISGFGVGVLTRPSSRINAAQNCIQGNEEGVRGAPQQDFGNNWWGSRLGPSGDGPGDGDSVQGASFLPFLTLPPPACSLINTVSLGRHQIPALTMVGQIILASFILAMGLLGSSRRL